MNDETKEIDKLDSLKYAIEIMNEFKESLKKSLRVEYEDTQKILLTTEETYESLTLKSIFDILRNHGIYF